jgi:hypothetical protein
MVGASHHIWNNPFTDTTLHRIRTSSHPSWSNLLHLRFYSGNNLRVRRNVPMFYIDLWLACAHPKIPLHLCYQKNSDCPTATQCALDLVEFEQGGEDSH